MYLNLFRCAENLVGVEPLPVVPLPVRVDWSFGVINYNHQCLLDDLAEGISLEIKARGICRFASDVNPQMVEQVVKSFELAGTLIASPQVREVLESKKTLSKASTD